MTALTATPSVPLVDLARQHRELAHEIEPAVLAVLARADFVQGSAVAAFEAAFAQFSGTEHCAGVANGTDAPPRC